MTRTLVLVHTVAPLVDAFAGWCAELLPGVRLWHILDEPLLERIRLRGSSGPADELRLAGHLAMARDLDADAVLVTCSTVSRVADAVRADAGMPVLTIDAALGREAVRAGSRIGLVATNPTTLEPSTDMLHAAARAAGRVIEVAPRLVDGALPALLAGDAAAHDALVVAAVREAAIDADVVVLAQASMARVMPRFADSPARVDVLASPMLALHDVRRLFEIAASARPPAQGEENRP